MRAMNFKEWFDQSNYTVWGLARLCGVARGTILSLLEGNNPSGLTFKKLEINTRHAKMPITESMFKSIRRSKYRNKAK